MTIGISQRSEREVDSSPATLLAAPPVTAEEMLTSAQRVNMLEVGLPPDLARDRGERPSGVAMLCSRCASEASLCIDSCKRRFCY